MLEAKVWQPGKVPTVSGAPRPLTGDDLEWVLDLSERRRERLVGFAPRLWRPAPEARDRHQAFLAPQVDDLSVTSLRTDHGFVFAAPRGDLLDVDDLALDDDGRWPQDGCALLRAVFEAGDLRLVCPGPEPARRETAVELGMTLVESWWHRDLATAASPAAGGAVLHVPGASGRLVDAPPVYAPGGPVLLTSDVEGGRALRAIESAAASGGAVAAVVARKPGQPAEFLTEAGYRRTSDFFLWRH